MNIKKRYNRNKRNEELSTQVGDVTGNLNNLPLFFGCMIIAALVEIFTGWLLDPMVHSAGSINDRIKKKHRR